MGGQQSISRRELLGLIGSGGIGGVAGCNQLGSHEGSTGTPSSPDSDGISPTPTSTDKEWDVDPLDHDKEIRARYYPWHYDRKNWLEDSPGNPVLGKYNSRDEEVINQHIKWALEHGITQFVMSWWGPGDFTDVTMQDHFLEAELASEIRFSISYPSPGLLSSGDPPEDETIPMNPANQRRLKEHFRYLEDNYFDRGNYAEIDGKPCLFLYNFRTFTGDIREAVSEIRNEVEEVYLIADIVGWSPQRRDKQVIGAFDGITAYTMFLPDVGEKTEGDWDTFRAGTEDWYRWWSLAAQEEEVDFIPMTLPGFNDRYQRPQANHPILEKDVEKFREFNRMARKYMDPDLKTIALTSFNEWQEYTAVEPGEEYGEKFLDAIEDTICDVEIDYFAPSEYDSLSLVFNETFSHQGDDDRDLALFLIELDIRAEDERIASYNIGVPDDEPIFTEGAYQPDYHNKEVGYFRWLGGLDEEAHIRFKTIESPTEAIFYGSPFKSGLSADVYFNEEKTDSVVFDRGLAEYPVSLA